MTKLHVIYVDDDQLMLKATARMFRRLRPEWTITLVSDPLKWEENITAEPSLIISDLLMPKLNGDKLLAEVRHRYPYAIRCLITGNTNQDVPDAISNYAHFILPKPFTENDILAILDSAEQLHNPPFNADCLAKISNTCEHIPVLPKAVKDIQAIARNKNADLKELADAVRQEPAVAARVIQLANSSYLGFQSSTVFLEVAISRLGAVIVEAVAVCMLGHKSFIALTEKEHDHVVERFTTIAASAKSLAKSAHLSLEEQESAFIMSLLISIGMLTLEESGIDDALCFDRYTFSSDYDDVILITVYVLTLWGYSRKITASMLNIRFSLTTLNQDEVTNCVSLALAMHIAKQGGDDEVINLLQAIPEKYNQSVRQVLKV
ncbi:MULTISPECIES: HDOD domain-containing protein [Vibrio]|nr:MULTISPECIES: HDOD domain-containing protein [Vibrio]MBF9002748.1 HDOD domain-containing protein [Vibrio nitrifigilis]